MQERIAAASRSCSDTECLAAWAPGVESGSLMRTSLSLLLAGAAALLVATCGDSAKLPEQATGIPIDVLTGFVSDDEKAFGRPVGVTIAKDGSLLVADDVGNTIWRVSRAAQTTTR
jgi:hypothetical protein